jgi:hypothetical protein
MKLFVALLLLSCLFASAFAQMRLEEVENTKNSDGVKFPPEEIKGRGFVSGDAYTAPCGQGVNAPVSDSERVFVKGDKHFKMVVTIVNANGGGVISAYYGAGSNPDPLDITFETYLGAYGQIQDYGMAKTYEIKVKTPKVLGEGTIQLVYTSNDGKNSFQCIDVIVN